MSGGKEDNGAVAVWFGQGRDIRVVLRVKGFGFFENTMVGIRNSKGTVERGYGVCGNGGAKWMQSEVHFKTYLPLLFIDVTRYLTVNNFWLVILYFFIMTPLLLIVLLSIVVIFGCLYSNAHGCVCALMSRRRR